MKTKVLLSFPPEASGHSIIYDLFKHCDIEINILRASIDFNAQGFMLVDVKGQDEEIQKALTYLDQNQVKNTIINSAIIINEEKCVDCGACVSVCKVGALSLNKDYELSFDNEKCLDCKICVTACPARAIEAIL